MIGAMTTYAAIVASPEVAAGAADPRARSRATIADVQVRNRGTIGGNVCSNDPTNHFPPLLAALGAELTIRGADGERTVVDRRVLRGRLHDRRPPGRAADDDPHPGEGRRARRLGLRHARQGGHRHRQRRRDRLRRQRAARDRLRRRHPGRRHRAAPTRPPSRDAVRARRPRPARRRPRLRRLPAPPRRGARRAASQ